MKTSVRGRKQHLFALVILLSLILFGSVSEATEPCLAGTSIDLDETWASAGNPYVIDCTLTVSAGVTLTVEAGTRVEFAENRSMFIKGTLNATGAIFTGTTETPGWWNGLDVSDGGSATFSNSEIKFGSENLFKTGAGDLTIESGSLITDSNGHGIRVYGFTGSLLLDDSTVQNNTSDGIYFYNSNGTLEINGNSLISGNGGAGVQVFGSTGVHTINNSTIENNGSHGIYLRDASSVAGISGSTISNNGGYGVYIYGNSEVPAFASNTFVGNTPGDVGIGGTISTDKTWSDQGFPYILEGVSVGASATLIVEPGVEVRSVNAKILTVNGNIMCTGATFTGTDPTPGWWQGISVDNGATGLFDACTVMYGGRGSARYANIYKTGSGTLTIQNSTIANSSFYGVRIASSDGTHEISDSVIENNGRYGIYMSNVSSPVSITGNAGISGNGDSGLYINGSSAAHTITGNAIENNGEHGIYLHDVSSSASVGSNTISNNSSFGVYIYNDTVIPLFTSPNTIEGNTLGDVGIGGTIATDKTWTDWGFPYILNSVSVNAAVTLTIEPGVIIKAPSNRNLTINGVLQCTGAVFTDLRDDMEGGDTNEDGAATSPLPGGWGRIAVNDGGSAVLDGCSMKYGGSGSGSVYKTGTGTLTIQNGSSVEQSGSQGVYIWNSNEIHTISNSTVDGNSSHGIYLYNTGAAASISGNTISNNGTYGIYVYADSEVPALSGNTFSANVLGDVGIGGTIATDKTWPYQGIPYILEGMTVGASATLTVDPNVESRFVKNSSMTVNGNLLCNGAIFTGTTETPGWWGRINVSNGGSADFDACEVKYAGSGATGANIYKYRDGNLMIQNSSISNSSRYGVVIDNSDGIHSISDSTIQDNGTDGIYLNTVNNAASLTGNTISGSGRNGVYVNSSTAAHTINGNTIENNTDHGIYLNNVSASAAVGNNKISSNGDFGVYVYNDTEIPTFTSNTLSANVSGAVGIGGTLATDKTWPDQAGITYILNTVWVNPLVTLTINPGVVIKSHSGRSLYIDGILDATGAVFTDLRDDTEEGDTNEDGTATSAEPGWWWGISVRDGASAVLDGCVVKYGGFASGTVYKTGVGNLTIQNSSSIAYSLRDGVYISNSDGTHTISDSTIENNGSHGIYLRNVSVSSVVSNNAIRNNKDALGRGYGVFIDDDTETPVFAGNTIEGNGSGDVGIGGMIATNKNWPKQAGITYILENVTVGAGALLTPETAQVLKFAGGRTLTVNGSLDASGIVFTDLRDDTEDGDTNEDGGATVPAANGWGRVYVADGGAATIDSCIIKYGGYSGFGVIEKIGPGILSVSNSRISDSTKAGILINNSTECHTISGNLIKNVMYGVRVQNSSCVTITGNRIYDNDQGVYALTSGNPLVSGLGVSGCNDIYNNSDYSVHNSTDAIEVNAQYNFWGGECPTFTTRGNVNTDFCQLTPCTCVTYATYYRDSDSDGYGDPFSELIACADSRDSEIPAGYVTNRLDCDDSDAAINPDAVEGPYTHASCSDGEDNDCDGETDYPDDPGCIALTEIDCADVVDNDGDGLIDCADPDCDLFTGSTCNTGFEGICSTGTTLCYTQREICIPDDAGCSFWCADTADCNAGEYCAKPDGICGGVGFCAPDPGPEACILLADPVCGCDGNTYSNPGCAEAAGISIDCHGTCPCEEVSCFNGSDDDSDGLPDCEDPDCKGKTGISCETGLPGICSAGVITCSGVCTDQGEMCLPAAGPEQEGPPWHLSCQDELDNDCDGNADDADEDCVAKCVITSGETKTGTLKIPNYADTCTFTGTAGEHVVITSARLTGSVSPEIYLYPPDDGMPETAATGIFSGFRLEHTLLKTGQYKIVISDWNKDDAGNYGLALVKIPGKASSLTDNDGGTILSGQTRTGTLNDKADTDAYQFYGEAGDNIIITSARLSGTVSPEIYLYSPAGPIEASETGIFSGFRLDHELAHSGVYTIIISDWSLDDEGAYGVAFAKIPGSAGSITDDDGGPISPGIKLTRSLTLNADTDVFEFYGAAGDDIEISTSRVSGTVSPEIYLYDPDGTLEDTRTGIFTDFTLARQLLQTGLYKIVISDWNLDDEGDYSIKLTAPDRSGIGNPHPSNGASVYNFSDSFSWDAVPGATGYDLYFGESAAGPLTQIGTNIPAASMSFPALEREKMYSWHVVAHTSSGDVDGPYWWFSTVTDADKDGVPDDGDCSGSDEDALCTDGVAAGCDDNCRQISNFDQVDTDSDEVGDACDNCSETYNPGQQDTDDDGYGNICDADLDNNGAVGGSDFNIFKAAWLSNTSSPNWNPDADMDSNGAVGGSDFNLFKTRWLKTAPFK